MLLHKKLFFLVGSIFLVVLSSTLVILFLQSRVMVERQAQRKALSVIITVNSSLESNISLYQFRDILTYLKAKNPDILGFSVYTLSGSRTKVASVGSLDSQSRASNWMDGALYGRSPKVTVSGNIMDVSALIDIHGKPKYVAFVKMSIQHELSLVRELLINVFTIGFLAMVLAMAFLWVFLRRFVSKPLVSITSAANSIAHGELELSVQKYEGRRDEIGMLARGFGSMAHSLHGLIRGISIAARQLNTSFQDLLSRTESTLHSAYGVAKVLQIMSKTTSQYGDRAQSTVELALDLHALSDGFIESCESSIAMSDEVMDKISYIRSLVKESQTCDEESIQDTLHMQKLYTSTSELRQYLATMHDHLDGHLDTLHALDYTVTQIEVVLRRAQDVTNAVAKEVSNVSEALSEQLDAVQSVNSSAALLNQMAMELSQVIAVFDLDRAV